MEPFILDQVDALNERLTPTYGSILWYLDTEYQEGDPLYFLGYAESSNTFIDVGVHIDEDSEDTVNIRVFDGEDWNLI